MPVAVADDWRKPQEQNRPNIGVSRDKQSKTLLSSIETTLDAPIERVWQVIGDPRNLPGLFKRLRANHPLAGELIRELRPDELQQHKSLRQKLEAALHTAATMSPVTVIDSAASLPAGKENAKTYHFYRIVKMPLFFKDRWYLAEEQRYRDSGDPEKLYLTYRRLAGTVEFLEARWTLTPVGAEQTHVEFRCDFHLGLSVPKFLLGEVRRDYRKAVRKIRQLLTANRTDLASEKLIGAYPDHLSHIENNHLVWADGTRMVWDDGHHKSFEAKLSSPDLEDMMSQNYAEHGIGKEPPLNHDPGRIRYEPFFLKMYGASKEEVKKRLTTIHWFGQTLRVTTINGIHDRLRNVRDELIARPHLKQYVTDVGGTFNWRTIAGTPRISMHSFGCTIDINVALSHYWRRDGSEYQNDIPKELVRIFEKHGFIWGGRWYHYDTMHFEYRPELL